MKRINKLLGASAIMGISLIAGASVSTASTADEDKNFTISESPKTTVFNMRTPSGNRHVHGWRSDDQRAGKEPKEERRGRSQPAESDNVTAYVDKYLVRLDKSAPRTAALNEPFTYNHTVTAKDNLSKAVVTEQIPEGAEYVSSSPEAEVSGNTVTWTLRDLQRGEEVPLSLTVRPTEPTDLKSCATIVAHPKACTTTTVGVPELDLTKSTPNREVLMDSGVPWNITVTNTGNYPAKDVVVTDELPGGVSHETGDRRLTTELGTLAPGESRDLTVNTTATRTGEHTNVASVEASNAEGAQDDAVIEVVEAGLDVTKEGLDKQFVRKEASYEITVTNTGEVDLSDVVVTDTVPTGTELINAPGAEIDGNTATWTTNLGAGQSKNYELTVRGLEDGNFCNEVIAESDSYNVSASDEACTDWRGYPALLIEVIDTVDPLLEGEETTYVIQVSNQGTAPDRNIRITAEAPEQLEVVSASGATRGTIDGRSIEFAPYDRIEGKENIEYRVKVRAVETGDGRFRVKMSSELLPEPVPEEEATQVY